MLTFGLRHISAKSTAEYGLPRCCEPVLAIPPRLRQSDNITALLPVDFQYLLGMAMTVLVIEGQSATVNVPTVNSSTLVFNLAALRIDRLTRRVFRTFSLCFRAAFNHLTFSIACLGSRLLTNLPGVALPIRHICLHPVL